MNKEESMGADDPEFYEEEEVYSEDDSFTSHEETSSMDESMDGTGMEEGVTSEGYEMRM